MTRSKTFSPKKCSQQAKRIQRILLAAVLIAGAMFLLWGKAQKPEMLDVKLEEIKMISYGSESIGITEPEQLRQEYARLNGIPFVPQKFRNFPAILEHRKIQANPL